MVDLAVGACESLRAVTGVGALAGVEAGSVVAARLVVGAVVQVLVAEQTAPTLVAEAVPRLYACAVHAAWVTLAFVAKRTYPTRMTSATKTITISTP